MDYYTTTRLICLVINMEPGRKDYGKWSVHVLLVRHSGKSGLHGMYHIYIKSIRVRFKVL